MAIKYIGFKKKGDRYLITLEISSWFGFVKVRKNYIDSASFYTDYKGYTAFFNFPEMTVLAHSQPEVEILNGCLRKILLDETGVVHLLGENRETIIKDDGK